MRVVLGVTGGVAAYKAADLTSQLVKAGHDVRVVMTRAAVDFVGPLTFEALTNHPVMIDALATSHAQGQSSIDHIAWARWAELVVVAPLTANTLGKIACGLADDGLTTTLLALEPHVPVLLCPAMNVQMWENPVVQRNLRWIADLGRYDVVAPAEKRLACGEVGVGGLAEVPEIVAAIQAKAAGKVVS